MKQTMTCIYCQMPTRLSCAEPGCHLVVCSYCADELGRCLVHQEQPIVVQRRAARPGHPKSCLCSLCAWEAGTMGGKA